GGTELESPKGRGGLARIPGSPRRPAFRRPARRADAGCGGWGAPDSRGAGGRGRAADESAAGRAGAPGHARRPPCPPGGPRPPPPLRGRGAAPGEGGPVAIGAHGLVKQYGDFTAVRDLTLAVCHGEIYGLLGANGAGKTTTIKMLCGLVEPTAGETALAGIRG